VIKKILLILIIFLAIFLRFYNFPNNPPSLNWDEASLGYNAWTLLNYGTDEYGNSWPFSIRSFNDYKPPMYSYLTMIPIYLFGLNEFSIRFTSAFLGVLTVIVTYFLVQQLFYQREVDLTSPVLLTKTRVDTLALLSSALLAISPWHLQFSRAAFEGNVAVFFTTLGFTLLLHWLNRNSSSLQPPLSNFRFLPSIIRRLFSQSRIHFPKSFPSWLAPHSLKSSTIYFLAIFSLIAALYSYHAARLVVPLIATVILARYFKVFLRHWQLSLATFLLLLVTLTPLLVVTLRGGLSARAGAVSIFQESQLHYRFAQRESAERDAGSPLWLLYDKRIEYLRLIFANYLDHYDISHMFITGDIVERHHAPNMGLFYLLELPFVILGIATLLVRKFAGKLLFWSWWLIAPLPAALATGTPHAIRAISWLPLPQIATAVGVYVFVLWLKGKIYSPADALADRKHDGSTSSPYPDLESSKQLSHHTHPSDPGGHVARLLTSLHKHISSHSMLRLRHALFFSICTGFLLLAVANLTYYLFHYHVHMPIEYARSWQYGYKQLVSNITSLQDQYDHIIVTTSLDQPYIFFLLYQQYDLTLGANPGDFDKHFGKYSFRPPTKADLELDNTLIVYAPDELELGEPGKLDQIQLPDGQDIFWIYRSRFDQNHDKLF
jgi:4-amino-4-deoxy-L-arabinose transferase-like glycosyltransferase